MTPDSPDAILARHSKSFALAARLLPASAREDVAVLYAWCRRADDRVDLVRPDVAAGELARLRAELASVYRREPQPEPLLAAFRGVVERHAIPAEHPGALLDGLETDLGDVRLASLSELMLYAHRVAGVVGLMFCAVLGVREPWALRRAAHLGIAMQLTNVCRDVAEDWERRRLYLPADLFARPCGARAAPRFEEPLRGEAREPFARAVRRLLNLADCYYRSGDVGLSALPFRAAFAVRTARLVYAAIGEQIRRGGCDVFRGRAIVPRRKKLWLLARAGFVEAWERLDAALSRSPRRRRAPEERRDGSIAVEG